MQGALLGFGTEAEGVYAPALLTPGCPLEIAAVAADGAAERKAAGRAFPRARLYKEPGELLAAEKGLEFALAALPAALRAQALALALKHGLHALTHPPFCASTAEFDRLRQASAQTGRALFCAQPWERSVPYSSLSRVVTGGSLGEPLRAEVSISTPRRAGAGRAGGVTAALGWQAFSALLGLVRRQPLAVTARLGGAFPFDKEAPENSADMQVYFGGVTGTVRLTAGAHAPRFSAAITGSEGRAELAGGKLSLDLRGRPPQTVDFDENLDGGLARPGWLLQEFFAFRDAMLDPERRDAGLRNSRFCASLVKAAYHSAGLSSAAVPL